MKKWKRLGIFVELDRVEKEMVVGKNEKNGQWKNR